MNFQKTNLWVTTDMKSRFPAPEAEDKTLSDRLTHVCNNIVSTGRHSSYWCVASKHRNYFHVMYRHIKPFYGRALSLNVITDKINFKVDYRLKPEPTVRLSGKSVNAVNSGISSAALMPMPSYGVLQEIRLTSRRRCALRGNTFVLQSIDHWSLPLRPSHVITGL